MELSGGGTLIHCLLSDMYEKQSRTEDEVMAGPSVDHNSTVPHNQLLSSSRLLRLLSPNPRDYALHQRVARGTNCFNHPMVHLPERE